MDKVLFFAKIGKTLVIIKIVLFFVFGMDSSTNEIIPSFNSHTKSKICLYCDLSKPPVLR